ncbi:hypothetical protein [Natrialba aegyptia]|uniref:DUF8073 domain-containing protein n=1 Tax=Natrialba aegyptia DSM 13077 TaxID=1227491 RepID=M0B4E5_9EURY|nr:hypothetical protein [Natrialba aegyptia]ELZ05786.1 hypothetical protein C480_10325 [Natrialba aegyptia DSM 13077]
MSTRNPSKETMATRNPTQTADSTDPQSAMAWTDQWPTLDMNHDPQPLTTREVPTSENAVLNAFTSIHDTFPEPVEESDTRTTSTDETMPTSLSIYCKPPANAMQECYADDRPLTEIADLGGWNLSRVARKLRHAGVLEPHDDPRALAHLYHDCDYTISQLAEDAFGGDVCPETVRSRMIDYDIERETRNGETHYESLVAAAKEGSA